MPQVRVDLSEAPEIKLVPVGEYPIVIQAVELKPATTGTPMLVMELGITQGEYAESKLFDRVMLTGKGAWRTRQMLESTLGPVEGEAMDFDTDDLIGCEAIVKVSHEIYKEEDGGDGEPRAKVKGWKALPGADPGEDIFQ